MRDNTRQALLSRARELLDDGFSQEARIMCSRYCRKHQTDPDGWFLLGMINGKMARYADSADCFKRGLLLAPENAEAGYNLGKIYVFLRDYDQAILTYRRVLQIRPDFVEAYFNLGNVFTKQGDFERAIDQYRKALAIRPGYTRALLALTMIKKYGAEDEADVRQMMALATQENMSSEQRMYLDFALAKVHEDLNKYDQSFLFLLEANHLKRSSYDYSVSRHEALFNRIQQVFDRDFFDQRSAYGSDDEAPVFIVGMPRSGTTLIEQILSSHPQVYGAGELDDLEQVVLKTTAKLTPQTFPLQVVMLEQEDVDGLATGYLQRLTRFGAGSHYVTDKMPGNFLFIGMIRLLFPRARVIHCVRDPVDTCVSIFKQLFSGRHDYAYDLAELGQYYRLYQGLMIHWHAALPGFVHDVHYEALIDDQEGQTRRLLEFCGLAWDEACLSFHQSERPVQTVSAAQVRRKLYSSSVKKWRYYEHHLQPLLQILAAE
jgi:Tfp pilus assembly protein PilF